VTIPTPVADRMSTTPQSLPTWHDQMTSHPDRSGDRVKPFQKTPVSEDRCLRVKTSSFFVTPTPNFVYILHEKTSEFTNLDINCARAVFRLSLKMKPS
jgi:hypothetical protein